MDTKKPRAPRQPRPTLAEELVWIVGLGVSLHALLVRHDGSMGKQGVVHMATERADECVVAFLERFAR